jgi:cellulose biosynthesis protein BcsQ
VSRVITFYSYKGGTGRSMALANIAWVLASAGKRVLAIDWDLEAPGLHRYFQPFLTDKELSGQESEGVIDMAIDFAVRAATPVKDGEELDGTWYDAHADFSKWRQKLRWPSGETIRLGKNGRGEIDFVPAGRQGADYAKRVNRFDWHSFYEKLGGGAFFDAAKRKFDAYDYVLIDSRTGVSDTSGICTLHMPDTLVVCFTLNYQSIKGALAVAQSVREQRPEIRIFPVPMRIDGSEEKLLNRMKSYAASVFGPLLDSKINATDYWYSMEVPYFARYAYAEKLALFEERASITASTLPAMERLSGYLTDGDVRTAGPLSEAERALAVAEFEGIEEAGKADSPAQHTKPHVVILVHGIRTSALWQYEVLKTLRKEGFMVQETNYGYFDVVRFLSPWQLFAGAIVDDIARQVRYTLAINSGADCSIIANGFGTFLVARILRDHADLAFNRIIFCGSVVPYKFRFEDYRTRFNTPLINEVGTRDFWPVIAEAATFRYGSAGTYGFHRPGVVDRWHNGKAAGDFLNQQFCRKYWVPFLSEGRIVTDDEAPEPPPWWLRAVSTFQIKYVSLIAVGAFLWRWARSFPSF